MKLSLEQIKQSFPHIYALQMSKKQSVSKCRNIKTPDAEGKKRDSKIEATHSNIFISYGLSEFRRKVSSFEILAGYKIGKKKIQGIKYIADFVFELNNQVYVIDTKGQRRDVYKLKKKILGSRGIHIIELKDMSKKGNPNVHKLVEMMREGKSPLDIIDALLGIQGAIK